MGGRGRGVRESLGLFTRVIVKVSGERGRERGKGKRRGFFVPPSRGFDGFFWSCLEIF